LRNAEKKLSEISAKNPYKTMTYPMAKESV